MVRIQKYQLLWFSESNIFDMRHQNTMYSKDSGRWWRVYRRPRRLLPKASVDRFMYERTVLEEGARY